MQLPFSLFKVEPFGYVSYITVSGEGSAVKSIKSVLSLCVNQVKTAGSVSPCGACPPVGIFGAPAGME